MTEQRMVTWDELPEDRKAEINAGCMGLLGLTLDELHSITAGFESDEPPALYPLVSEHTVWLRETRDRVQAMPWWKRWMYWCPEEVA